MGCLGALAEIEAAPKGRLTCAAYGNFRGASFNNLSCLAVLSKNGAFMLHDQGCQHEQEYKCFMFLWLLWPANKNISDVGGVDSYVVYQAHHVDPCINSVLKALH